MAFNPRGFGSRVGSTFNANTTQPQGGYARAAGQSIGAASPSFTTGGWADSNSTPGIRRTAGAKSPGAPDGPSKAPEGEANRWRGAPDQVRTEGPWANNVTPATAGGVGPADRPVPEYGTQSGPGILEQWFNMRASGTDPAYEYAMGRGLDAIDTRMAAGGAFNSGARGQQLSDFAANMGAQRAGQLDALAGGASGEHRDRINSMFGQGLGLAGGQAGTAGQYDVGAANAMSAANQAILMMMLNKAGVDSQANQSLMNNIFSGIGLAKMK